MTWKEKAKQAVESRDHYEDAYLQENRKNKRYAQALKELADRLGIRENYSVVGWIDTYFDADLLVEDLEEIKKHTGAAERLTPPTENKPKKKENK